MGAYAPETGSQTSLEKRMMCHVRNSLSFVQITNASFGVAPVKGIAHLDGDQHRQGHGHGRTLFKDLAVNAGKVLIVSVALHEVGLHRGESMSKRTCVWVS